MLGISDYPAFVGAVIIFLAIPGPGNLALLAATAQGGRRGGLNATWGVIAGDQVLMWAAVAGLATVLQASPIWFNALQWAGALYLAYLGVQMIQHVAHRGCADFPVWRRLDLAGSPSGRTNAAQPASRAMVTEISRCGFIGFWFAFGFTEINYHGLYLLYCKSKRRRG